jgi:hypothetical protein
LLDFGNETAKRSFASLISAMAPLSACGKNDTSNKATSKANRLIPMDISRPSLTAGGMTGAMLLHGDEQSQELAVNFRHRRN